MTGYATPEDAAIGDIPRRFVRVASAEMSQSREEARVILELLDDEGRPLLREECACFREDERWFADSLGTDPA